MPTEATRYSPLAQIFHWVIAGLIVVQFTLARLAEPLPLGVHKLALLARHKSVGMTILMLAVLRLAWRLWHGAPPLPPEVIAHTTAKYLEAYQRLTGRAL